MILRAFVGGLMAGMILPAATISKAQSRSVDWKPPLNYRLGAAVIVPHQKNIKQIFLSGRRMSFLAQKNVWLGIAPLGKVALYFQWQSDSPQIEFSEYLVPTESPQLGQADPLRLPASVWKKVNDPSSEARQRDRKILSAILNDYSGRLDTSCWKLPLRSRITSGFGTARRLPDGHSYHHSGEDRRAMIGTPVFAAGAGRVAFAGEMVVPGTNVILAHGEGWFSRYLHFSKTLVTQNQKVTTGQKIGLSGASGRVEAPHLHWEIVWQGIAADPGQFLPAWERLCDPKST